MNNGLILTQALQRSRLPVDDFNTRQTAMIMFNEVVQKWWSKECWFWKHAKFYIQTADGVEEYSLDKLCAGVDRIVPNSMRGSDPVRRIRYKPKSEFLRSHAFSLESSDPYQYRAGEMRGVLTDVSGASQITLVSSETNHTSGTVAIVNGLERLTFSSAVLTKDYEGIGFRVGTNAKRYIIRKVESSTVAYVNEPIEEASDGTASYTLGDVYQKATVLGYDTDYNWLEETVQLNGSTAVVTANSFSQLIKITKSDQTKGYVKATSNGGLVTNANIDPMETEIDYQTILFYPIPDKTELISYWSEMNHPTVRRDNDSVLIPSRWHHVLTLDLYRKLMNEWHEKDVKQTVLDDIQGIYLDMVTENNDTSNWTFQQEAEEDSLRPYSTNLPNAYGYADEDY